MRRCLLVATILVAATGIFTLAINWSVEALGLARVLTLDQLADQPSYDCVIVPGALVYADGTPSLMLQDRLDMAIQIYQTGITNRILVSGDHGRPDYDEVNSMRTYLINHGIAPEVIFMDRPPVLTPTIRSFAPSRFSASDAR